MHVTYGSYALDADASEVTISSDIIWNNGGQILAIKHTWEVQGHLGTNSDGEAGINARVIAFLNGVQETPFQDLSLRLSDDTPSVHTLVNSGSISGVRVTNVRFPEGKGPQFSAFRTFGFTAEAEYLVSGADFLTVSFSETIAFAGGGPLYTHLPALIGPPQKQLIYEMTPYEVVQRGEAVGFTRYPVPPVPIWPGALKKSPTIEKSSPKRNARGYTDWRITWSYEYESATPLIGNPNLWIA